MGVFGIYSQETACWDLFLWQGKGEGLFCIPYLYKSKPFIGVILLITFKSGHEFYCVML